MKETIRDKRANTICWHCAKACGGCPWSARSEPIEGWTAEHSLIQMETGRYADTYEVIACPQFEYEAAHEYEYLDPDGIKALAVGVLTRAIRDRKILKAKAENATGDEAGARRRSLALSIKHIEKAFDPDGLWMQLAGIDDSGADQVIKGDRKPLMPRPRKAGFKMRKGCKGCVHWRAIASEVFCCNYVLDTEKKRPCPPGRGCTARTDRKRGETK